MAQEKGQPPPRLFVVGSSGFGSPSQLVPVFRPWRYLIRVVARLSLLQVLQRRCCVRDAARLCPRGAKTPVLKIPSERHKTKRTRRTWPESAPRSRGRQRSTQRSSRNSMHATHHVVNLERSPSPSTRTTMRPIGRGARSANKQRNLMQHAALQNPREGCEVVPNSPKGMRRERAS